MKLFSNLSRRDRGLLMILLVAIIFYLCYTFIITPALQVGTVLKSQITSVESDLNTARDIVTKQKELKQKEIDLKKELSGKYSGFFASLDQSRLLYQMDTLMQGANLSVSSYTPAPETVSQVPVEQGTYASQNYPLLDLAKKIQPDLYQQEGQTSSSNNTEIPAPAPAPSGEAVATPDMIPGVDVTFNCDNASYESVYAFISAIEQMNKTVVLKNLNLTKNDTGLTGQLTFGFYSLPALDTKQKDELKFTPAIPKGKANPFQ